MKNIYQTVSIFYLVLAAVKLVMISLAQEMVLEVTTQDILFWCGLVSWLSLWILVSKRLFFPAYYLSLFIAFVFVTSFYLRIEPTANSIVDWYSLSRYAYYAIYGFSIASIPILFMLYYYLFSSYLKRVLVTSKKLNYIKT